MLAYCVQVHGKNNILCIRDTLGKYNDKDTYGYRTAYIGHKMAFEGKSLTRQLYYKQDIQNQFINCYMPSRKKEAERGYTSSVYSYMTCVNCIQHATTVFAWVASPS